MPLVVPGLTSKNGGGGDDKTSQWMGQLMGKKIGDSSNETGSKTFAKKELPNEHRVIKEGDMFTQDHKPDRLNVHVGDDGTVKKVTHG